MLPTLTHRRFPVEFVIMVETRTGSKFYDNNGGFGVNYRLQPHKGYFSNIVSADSKICVFQDIIPYKTIDK